MCSKRPTDTDVLYLGYLALVPYSSETMGLSNTENLLLSKIVAFAVFSRLFYIFLQMIANALIPDHDAGVFNPPQSSENEISFPDQLIQTLIGGLRRWDAVYFVHTAEHGYTYENCLAFFPLYSLLTFLVSNSLLYPAQFVLQYSSVVLISAILLNQYLFIQTAKALFKLGLKVTGNDTISYKAALLFCINPATVFMIAPYSETLFMFLTVKGLLLLESNCRFQASLLFGLSCVTRSNGVLNAGYLLYGFLKNFIYQLQSMKKGMFMSFQTFCACMLILFISYILPYIVFLLTTLTPFVLYQYYSYMLYCTQTDFMTVPEYLKDYGKKEGYLVHGSGMASWCNDTIPLAYSYIQKKHWNLGLFNYYEFKQIPNFLLALPVTVISLCAIVCYYKYNSYTFWTLGLDPRGSAKKEKDSEQKSKPKYHLDGPQLVPYVIHLLVMVVFGWLLMHIQVLTRFLFSSAPVLFWFSAQVISVETPSRPPANRYNVVRRKSLEQNIEIPQNRGKYLRNLLTTQAPHDLHSKTLLTYFTAYSIIGIVLFSNFLPWT